MHIEIKDLQSGQSHRIDDKGAKLGRDKARADVAFADSGVSGLHARIYCKDKKWFVEDLKSSNGTFVNDAKITAPVELAVGTALKLYHYKLEVDSIESEDEGGSTAVFSPDAQTRQVVKSEVKKSTELPAQDQPTGITDAHDEEPKSKPQRISEKSPAASEPAADDDTGRRAAAAAPVDKAAFMTHFNKAFAYYLAAIPKLLFNFKGSVDKSIAEQNFAAMDKMELIAWAVPPLLLGVVVGQGVGLLLMIVSGHLAIVSFVIGLAIGAAVAVVAAVVTGFIFHPFMGWLVRVLKGKSDEKSRSNYFVILMTASGLTTVIGGIAGLFTIIPLPFIGVLPVLLSIVTSLITIFIAYRWFQFFAVVKWFQILLLVCGALAALSGLRNAYAVVDGGLAQLKAGRAVHDANAAMAGAGEQIADAQKMAAAAQDQAAVALQNGQAVIDAAKAQAAQAQAGGGAATGVAATGAAATGAATTNAKTAPAGSATATGTPTGNPTGIATPPAHVADNDLPPPPPPPSVGGHAAGEAAKLDKGGVDDFATYVAKRKAVDQAIEKNPALLANIDGALAQYKQLRAELQKLQAQFAKSKGKKSGDPTLEQVLRDQELYAKTDALVDALYKKIIER